MVFPPLPPCLCQEKRSEVRTAVEGLVSVGPLPPPHPTMPNASSGEGVGPQGKQLQSVSRKNDM